MAKDFVYQDTSSVLTEHLVMTNFKLALLSRVEGSSLISLDLTLSLYQAATVQSNILVLGTEAILQFKNLIKTYFKSILHTICLVKVIITRSGNKDNFKKSYSMKCDYDEMTSYCTGTTSLMHIKVQMAGKNQHKIFSIYSVVY